MALDWAPPRRPLPGGDIIITKASLASPSLSRSAPGAPSLQWHTTNLVDQTNMAAGITVNLSGISGNTNWTNAVRNALNSWSWTYGTKIKFVETTGAANITFNFGYLPSGVVAQASFPSGGGPGPTVTIAYAYASSLSSSQKQWVMVHELGHTVGYRHSNWHQYESSGTVGATQVPGTPYTDGSSVMRTGLSSVPSWSYFSSYDQTANGYLYPGTGPALTSAVVNGSSQAQLDWSSAPYASHHRVGKTTYYYEWIYYDPQVSNDGYYGWQGYYGGETDVYGNSYVDPWAAPSDPNYCYTQYDVYGVYPSGKGSQAASTTLEVC